MAKWQHHPAAPYSPICQLIPHTRYFRAKIRQICRRMPFLPNNWPPTVKIGTMRAEVCRISIFCQHARSGFSTLKGFSTKLSTLCTNAYFHIDYQHIAACRHVYIPYALPSALRLHGGLVLHLRQGVKRTTGERFSCRNN